MRALILTNQLEQNRKFFPFLALNEIVNMDVLFACFNQPEKTDWLNKNKTENELSEEEPIMWFFQKAVHQIQSDPAYSRIHTHPSYDPNLIPLFLNETQMNPVVDGDLKASAITDAYNQWVLQRGDANKDQAMEYLQSTRKQFDEERSKGWLDVQINKDAAQDTNIMESMQKPLPPPPSMSMMNASDNPPTQVSLPRLKPLQKSYNGDDETESVHSNESEPSSDSDDEEIRTQDGTD